MKKIVLIILATSLLLIGCGSEKTAKSDIQPKLVLGHDLSDMHLKTQQGKEFPITDQTRKIVFSFAKATGHVCNDFFTKEAPDFMIKNHILYVADVSPAPSLIKKFFILPDLKKLKFPILLINNETTSKEYKPSTNSDKIIIATLKNKIITKISYAKTKEELAKELISK